MISPKIEPIKIDLILLNLKKLITLLSNQEIKVINATARIIPGIAYPDTENIDND